MPKLKRTWKVANLGDHAIKVLTFWSILDKYLTWISQQKQKIVQSDVDEDFESPLFTEDLSQSQVSMLYQTLPCHISWRTMMHLCMTSMVSRNGSQKGKNNWQIDLCQVDCQRMAELNNGVPTGRRALCNLYRHNNTTKRKTGTGQWRWNMKDLVTCEFFSVTHHKRSGYFLPGKCLK